MFLHALACTAPSQDSAEPSDTHGPVDTDTGPIDDTGWEDPLALGALSGDCPLLTEVWGDTSPQLLETALSLDSGFDEGLLSDAGTAVWEAGNLGGSSAESEVVSMEVLFGCDGAALLATEGDIPYTGDGKKGDLYVEVHGHPVLVSVTRAFHYNDPDAGIDVDRAIDLLQDKIDGVEEAASLLDGDADRVLLHVLAYGDNDVSALQTAWSSVDAGEVLVLITRTDGDDEALY